MLSEKSLFADKIHIPIPIDNSVPDIVHSSLNGDPLTIISNPWGEDMG
jgi:hypothetical protein